MANYKVTGGALNCKLKKLGADHEQEAKAEKLASAIYRSGAYDQAGPIYTSGRVTASQLLCIASENEYEEYKCRQTRMSEIDELSCQKMVTEIGSG
jgi:hypothetical protein